MKTNFILLLLPLGLFAQDQAAAKPESPDPVTEKMRLDFMRTQRDYFRIQAQMTAAQVQVEMAGQAIKAACESVNMQFNPQKDDLKCIGEISEGPAQKRQLAQADPKKAIIPPTNSTEEYKKQMADAKKKKDEDDAKKAAEKK